MERSEGKFELKQCFVGVKLNGKGKWDPPIDRFANGLYNLGEEPSGELTFQFTLNPVALKETEKMIKKAADSGDTKLAELLKTQSEKPMESLEVDSISKANVSDQGAGNFFEMLVEAYKAQDEASMMELITNLAKESGVWFSQAHESLYVCKIPAQFAEVSTYLMSSMIDRHIRFAIGAQANFDDEQGMLVLMSQLKQ